MAAALGGLLFGYDWVVIGGAKPFFEKYFQLHSEVGGLGEQLRVAGLPAWVRDFWRSERPIWAQERLLLSAVLFAVSSVLTGSAAVFTWFVIWRIPGGVAIGMASKSLPCISPKSARRRGAAGWYR